MTMTRIQKWSLPDDFTPCDAPKACSYRSEGGYCDTPRINKGNSDAACHEMRNAELLQNLAGHRE